MNNYRVSVDLTISAIVRSDLNMIDVGGDIVHKICVAMRSLDNVDIRVGKVLTNLLDRPPVFAVQPIERPNQPIIDDDEFMRLDPEYGDYLDEDDL